MSKRNNVDEIEHLIGFVGYGCSFGGKWFGGLARGGKTSQGNDRNHVAESSRNLMKIKPKLQDMIIEVANYKTILIPDGSVVYCDPPYSTRELNIKTSLTQMFFGNG